MAISLLKVGEELAITDEGKAEIMRGRERTKGKCPGIIDKRESSDSPRTEEEHLGQQHQEKIIYAMRC